MLLWEVLTTLADVLTLFLTKGYSAAILSARVLLVFRQSAALGLRNGMAPIFLSKGVCGFLQLGSTLSTG